MDRSYALQTLNSRGLISNMTNVSDFDTCYCGFDPTAGSLHAGHLISIVMLSQLQLLGVDTIAVIGDSTAMIGDPSGRIKSRPMLSSVEVGMNAYKIVEQIKSLLPNTKIVFNSDWLRGMDYMNFIIEVGPCFNINRMLSSETYNTKLKTGLSFLEFNYQILQAYDYLTLYRNNDCTMQIGGDDQWSNILAGISLIKKLECGEAHGLTFPLLTNSNGEKMGKTKDGALWLDPELTSVNDFYQYWRNVNDDDVEKLFRYLTYFSIPTIQSIVSDIVNAKAQLAFEITSLVHGTEKALQAFHYAKAANGDLSNTDSIPEISIASIQSNDEGVSIVDILVNSNLATSRNDARRKIESRGVRVDNQIVSSTNLILNPDSLPSLIQFGKKNIRKIVK